MNTDRTAPATLGDLQDLKVELKVELTESITQSVTESVTKSVTESVTRSLSLEIGRVANVIMEHTTSQIRAAGDHPKAIEERLDAHIADANVHRRPTRPRRT